MPDVNLLASLVAVLKHPCNQGSLGKTLLRIVWWKLNQVFFGYPAIIELVPGLYCICPPSSSSGSMIVYTRLHEYGEMRFWSQIIESNDIVFDVGANLGDYSLLAAHQSTQGHTFAFEPVPEVNLQLQANVMLNKQTKRVTVIDKAVSDHSRTQTFVIASASEMSHLVNDTEVEGQTIKVKTVSLDNFCSQQRLARIDVLHIDVEGGEAAVLKGASRLLKNHKIGMILLETLTASAEQRTQSEAVLALLTGNEYDLYVFDDDTHLPTPLARLESHHQNILAISRETKYRKRLKAYLKINNA